MKTREDIEALEQLIVQLRGLHGEIAQLAKKSPNDALNKFKLKFVNKVLSTASDILQKYKPFADFNEFDPDDVPTNSDVTLMLAQYMAQAERFRSDNVRYSSSYGQHVYVLDGEVSNITASPPTPVGKE